MTFSKKVFVSGLLGLSVGLMACEGRKGPPTGDEGLYGQEDVTYAKDSTFRVESVSLEKAEVKTQDVFKLPETKELQFSACLTDMASGAPINLTKFAISDGKKEKIVRTNTSGCLIWEESLKISALQKERMIRFRRSFRGIQGFTGNVVVDLAMNPSEDSPSLYDLRKYTPPDVEKTVETLGFEGDIMTSGLGQASAIGAEAFLADVSLNFIGHDKKQTVITPLLRLKPAQKFRLRLEPKFVRRNLKNELVRLDLRGGEFKLKLLVLRDGSQDDPKLDDLVADYQGTIKVLYDGTATQDILLRIHDTSKILSRNRAVIILEPIGEAARVARKGVYSGFISPLKGTSASVSLVSADEKAGLMASRAEELLKGTDSSQTGREIFAKDSGYSSRQDQLAGLAKIFNLNQNPQEVHNSHIENIILRQSLCDLIYKKEDQVEVRAGWFGQKTKKASALATCKNDPFTYVVISQMSFVEGLKGAPRNIPELTSTSARNIAISRSLSWSKSAGTAVGAKIGGAFDPLGFLGIKIGIGSEIYASAETSRSTSQDNSINVSESQSFSVVRDAYEVDVMAKKCFVAQGALPGRGLYACESTSKAQTIQEMYYLVNYNVESSPFADEEADNRWRLTIRGKAQYEQFERMLTAENSVIQLMKLEIKPDMESSLLPDFKVNQVYPGVISEK